MDESYFKEAVDEMMRARTLCAKAKTCMPDNPTYVIYQEELFGRKPDDVRILTPFICDFGNRVKFGMNVTICYRTGNAHGIIFLFKGFFFCFIGKIAFEGL